MALSLAAATLPVAGAEVIYSNFGPGMSFNTNVYDGWTINGFFGPRIGQQGIAQQFTPAESCVFTDAKLALTSLSGPNSFRVFLQADSNGVPGGVIEEIDIAAGATPSVVSAISGLQPRLEGGTPYWLTVVAGAPEVMGGWSWNSIGDSEAYTFNGTQGGSPDGPWGAGPVAVLRSAFEVDGVRIARPRELIELLLADVNEQWPHPQQGLAAILSDALALFDSGNARVAVRELHTFQNKVVGRAAADPALAEVLVRLAEETSSAISLAERPQRTGPDGFHGQPNYPSSMPANHPLNYHHSTLRRPSPVMQ